MLDVHFKNYLSKRNTKKSQATTPRSKDFRSSGLGILSKMNVPTVMGKLSHQPTAYSRW
jgi:hypothetical protein